jgi:hypothetical protein
MLNRTKINIDIFLRDPSTKDLGKIAYKVMNKLKFERLTVMHLSDTNHILVALSDKINLSEKIKQIDKIQEIAYFILWTNPKQETAEAIANHDYFKAFALCSTTYDDLGKRILIRYINKNNVPVKEKKIEGLQLSDVIDKLCDYGLIDENLKSDMTKVNKIRIKFIHYKLYQVIKKEQLEEIYQNIGKIKTSLNMLQKIFDDLK